MDNLRLSSNFKHFLRLLNTRQVEYLLVGGYAVGYYGYTRPTKDLDVWTGTDPANAAKLVSVCKEFGGELPALTTEPFLEEWRIIEIHIPPISVEIRKPIIGSRPEMLRRITGTRAEAIEILTVQSGVNFADCYPDRVVDMVDGVEVNIISLAHLKTLKRSGNRPEDIQDLAHLP
jgi:hypothetical protein